MLQIRGGRLWLRGPLPRKDGQPGLLRQRLSLGLPADEPGLVRALERLAELERQLEEHRFRWEHWRRPPRGHAGGDVPLQTAGEPRGIPGSNAGRSRPATPAKAAADPPLEQRLSSFEQAFFADPRRRRRSGSRTTWTAAYLPYLRRLAAHADSGNPQPFGAALLEEVKREKKNEGEDATKKEDEDGTKKEDVNTDGADVKDVLGEATRER